MWMTIYNEENVRRKIFLHFTSHNDKKTAENHVKSGDTPLFILFQAKKWDGIAENNHSFVN